MRPTAVYNCNFPVGTTWKTPTGYELNFTIEGTLELLSPTQKRLWESGTRGRGAGILSMQRDGDLVIYDAARRRAIWSSGTKGHNRRRSNGAQYLTVVGAALKHPVSRQWKGYRRRGIGYPRDRQ